MRALSVVPSLSSLTSSVTPSSSRTGSHPAPRFLPWRHWVGESLVSNRRVENGTCWPGKRQVHRSSQAEPQEGRVKAVWRRNWPFQILPTGNTFPVISAECANSASYDLQSPFPKSSLVAEPPILSRLATGPPKIKTMLLSLPRS